MPKYDDLFAATATTDSVFADKGALDPLTAPTEVVARDAQEHALARLLQGVHEGYLPPTVSIHGPPGTGKTLTTRRVCDAFAARTDAVAVEYVNLKECRTVFGAANEIHWALTGAKKGAYEGLDGVFEGIWEALDPAPAWTVLLLDESDHLHQDTNYDPSDFFYRLVRGEEKRARARNLSVWLLSNELLDVDLRVDSRVQSALSGEAVFFPPYTRADLTAILAPRLKRAFRDGALPDTVRAYGVERAADRWGDARKALTLFRQAGETAAERDLNVVTRACIDANLESTERAAVLAKLTQLPFSHFHVLLAIASYQSGQAGERSHPVTTQEIVARSADAGFPERFQLGARAVREVVTALETMGLVETWVESRGRQGRVKRIVTTFDPAWVHTAQAAFIEQYEAQTTEGGETE